MIIGHWLDYIIVLGYMVGILAFGMLFSRYTRSTKEFFLAGQRFSWWLISFSCVASLVGSYSFIKYSEAAYKYGLSATQGYLNDWWWMPIWMFCWIPIIYYNRVISIPEYFELRFNQSSRIAATAILIIYMVGYIGINLYTLGTALKALLGWDVLFGSAITAIIVMVYVSSGGQTSVIMTDLLQGVMLLIAGLTVTIAGLFYIGGISELWSALPLGHKLGLSQFNQPADFPFVGIFWQDSICNTAAFWFMNQGILMRFMSAKSVREARKAIWLTVLIFMPIAALAVSGPGLIGKAMVNKGLLSSENLKASDIFILVTNRVISTPGLFGLIIAALVAALMSTADTLLNATSAVFVNDIWRLYIKRGASDRHYLIVARVVTVISATIGILLVPVFARFKTIYQAHAAFTASITPPMVTAILLGCTWKRYTPKAAFWTLIGGISAMALSIKFPSLITPLSHGVPMEGSGFEAHSFMRALFGLVISFVIGMVITLLTRPKPKEELVGLVWGTEKEAATNYKKKLEL